MTPPTAPARLFDEGCCLCGNPHSDRRRRDGSNAGFRYCYGCFESHGCNWEALDAEITRRRSLAPPTGGIQWEPKVGDWIEGTGTDKCRYFGQIVGVIGTARDVRWADGTTTRWGASLLRPWAPQPGDRVEFQSNGNWYPGELSSESKPGSGLWSVRDGSGCFTARRESEIRPASAHRTESEYFDAQPSDAELPRTLPAGVRAMQHCGPWSAVGPLRLDGNYYVGGWKHRDRPLDPRDGFMPQNVDWKSVRRSPPSTETGGKASYPSGMLGCLQCKKPVHGGRCFCDACETAVAGGVVKSAAEQLAKPAPPATSNVSPWDCKHPRRFRSGLCVTCGHVGPGENDAGYAIRGEHETEPEAVARRERVGRMRESDTRGATMTRLDVIQPGGKMRRNDGPLDQRISECRASLETDGKARREAVSTHPPSFPEGAYHDAPECYSTTRSRGGR